MRADEKIGLNIDNGQATFKFPEDLDDLPPDDPDKINYLMDEFKNLPDMHPADISKLPKRHQKAISAFEAFKKQLRKIKHAHNNEQIQAFVLYCQGETKKDIAKKIGKSRVTVTKWLSEFPDITSNENLAPLQAQVIARHYAELEYIKKGIFEYCIEHYDSTGILSPPDTKYINTYLQLQDKIEKLIGIQSGPDQQINIQNNVKLVTGIDQEEINI